MSFKREGDDGSQLNVLKKRRVAELLASFIPEDEALLLKNGRYACTVCTHRPVFDTLDMLTVHRAGKKHVASLQWFYGKKRDQENEVQKRQQVAFLKAEEAGGQVPAGPAPLLAQTRRITHHALLKATPYNSCCRRSRSESSGTSTAHSGSEPSAIGTACESSGAQSPYPGQEAVGVEATPSSRLRGHQSSSSGSLKGRGWKVKKRSTGKATPRALCPEVGSEGCDQRRAIEHYLLLRSSGWIQDASGQWTKDENVEFDSDEEQPPAFLTL
ncbi:sodium channel modifier 1-like [Rhinatrema bivittatum]|uniref:sodium channel modifier 1-like n=1 Tax=Rhinatrema bivittatum TaxID=194408 RepID=UPI001125F008|nr:sodium channel modifier 1-like [Rhinatrema bivittatum]XP_029436436.1 sodium channel modifier 1-like [Rhinatrema bivittatum]